MLKWQKSTIFGHKKTPVGTNSHKRFFLPVKEHFFINIHSEFCFCDSIAKGYYRGAFDPQTKKKFFFALVKIAFIACHAT